MKHVCADWWAATFVARQFISSCFAFLSRSRWLSSSSCAVLYTSDFLISSRAHALLRVFNYLRHLQRHLILWINDASYRIRSLSCVCARVSVCTHVRLVTPPDVTNHYRFRDDRCYRTHTAGRWNELRDPRVRASCIFVCVGICAQAHVASCIYLRRFKTQGYFSPLGLDVSHERQRSLYERRISNKR